VELVQLMLNINGLKYQTKPLLSLENACAIDNAVLVRICSFSYSDVWASLISMMCYDTNI
jgi:hypothetical protein